MLLETERLILTELTPDMAGVLHKNSLDEDNRRFVPDEVFETEEEALDTIRFLMSQYQGKDGPLVYALLTKNGNDNIGYIQLCPIEGGWEIGYHIAKQYTGNGYATEAALHFLPYMAEKKHLSEIFGICLEDNIASVHVLKKCGFRTVFCGTDQYQGEPRKIVRTVWTL